MSQKKILVVCQHFWPEQFRINDIVDFFISEGYSVDVVCGRPNYPSGKLAEGYSLWNKRHENYKGARIYRAFEIPRGNNSNLRILINYLSFPVGSLFLLPRLLRNSYDRVFLYQLSPVMMSLVGLLVAKIKKIPAIMYVLDLWPENLFSVLKLQNKFLRALVTKNSHWYYRETNRLITLSEKMRQRILDITNKNSEDIVVIAQVAETLYETRVNEGPIAEKYSGTFNIVFTGNISPAQSFETLIEAAQILHDRGIENIKWIVIGDGMSRGEVERSVKQRGLEEQFTFEGHHPIEDMPKYLSIADVLVGCLSKSDLLEATVPAKVYSYIASGKPIVLAMDGEVQNLINDEIQCGFAGETENSVLLAQNILKVYNASLAERIEMGARAQKYHQEHFKREVVLRNLVDFIWK